MAGCDKQAKCWDLGSNQSIQVFSFLFCYVYKLYGK